MINKDYEQTGLLYFTLPAKRGSGSDISNTYAFTTGKHWYIIDTSCGKKRYRELKEFLKYKNNYTILCTHYHNDHIANNGRLVHNSGKIFYHPNARSKIRNLRTNATGQILMMYRELDKKGFLKRMGYFSDGFIDFMLKRKFTSEYVMIPVLLIATYFFSISNIGRIYPGINHIEFFDENKKIKVNLNGLETAGWLIDEGIYAIETPGHSDCHVMYYWSDKKILFTGDALNFLTPNDIQFGEIQSTMESQKMILKIADKENILMICQGHYIPLENNKAIVEYISDTIAKHEHVYNKLKNFLNQDNIYLGFDELYNRICGMDDSVIQKLLKITFPRSTLVFLDVYLLKVIKETMIKNNFPEKEICAEDGNKI